MNKRGKPCASGMICILLAVVLSIGSLDLPKVQAQQTTENRTAGSEKIWETDRCRITYLLTDCWAEGYTAAVTVENTGDTAIENWHVAFPLRQELTNVWNAQIIDDARETAVFKNLGWNQDIPAGESSGCVYTAAVSFDGYP